MRTYEENGFKFYTQYDSIKTQSKCFVSLYFLGKTDNRSGKAYMGENNEKNSIIRGYGKLCRGIFLILLLVIGAVEIFVFKIDRDAVDIYKVEIGRVENELREHAAETAYEPDLSAYDTILGIERLNSDSASASEQNSARTSDADSAPSPEFFTSNYPYVIRNIAGTLYRIEYDTGHEGESGRAFLIVNIVIACVILAVIIVLIYIYFAIIRNFHKLSAYPFELAKGNLTTPLEAKRTKYFGKFLWGLDMLREKLETEKNENLELQKEKNVFLLSLSHDIKTPLSAIKLYSAALRKNLYTDEDKIRSVAVKIDENAGEIENYVAKVISSSGDDFLNFDVKDGEFYLSEALSSIRSYYSDKLAAVGTKLSFDDYSDVLIKGDRDRLIEVLQNILENAIKYGDGREIGVSFEDEDGARLICIRNTGCTLPDEELGHIFDSFYRGSNVGSRGGSGLGLYICKKIMARMKGDVFAQILDEHSHNPAEGSGDETQVIASQTEGNMRETAPQAEGNMRVTAIQAEGNMRVTAIQTDRSMRETAPQADRSMRETAIQTDRSMQETATQADRSMRVTATQTDRSMQVTVVCCKR